MVLVVEHRGAAAPQPAAAAKTEGRRGSHKGGADITSHVSTMQHTGFMFGMKSAVTPAKPPCRVGGARPPEGWSKQARPKKGAEVRARWQDPQSGESCP